MTSRQAHLAPSPTRSSSCSTAARSTSTSSASSSGTSSRQSHERDQADRGRARPGLGGLGRERPDRGRQHHHQDAAGGAEGFGAEPHRAGSSTATAARGEATGTATPSAATSRSPRRPSDTLSWRLSAGYFNSDPYSRPVGIVGGCPLDVHCVPHPLDSSDPHRRRPLPARPRRASAASRTTGPASPRSTCGVDQEFTNSGGRLTYQGGYAGTDGHHPHRASAPSTSRAASYMAYGKRQLQQGRPQGRRPSPTSWTPRPRTCCCPIPTHRSQPVQLNFKTQTYDFEVGHSTVIGRQAHPELRRQRAPQQLRHHSRARTPRTETSSAPTSRRSSSSTSSAWPSGARVDKFGNLDKRRLLAARERDVQAHAGPLDPRVLQPRLPLALGRSTTTSTQDILTRARLSTSRLLAPLLPPPCGPWSPRVPLQVHDVGNELSGNRNDLKEESHQRLRARLHGHRSTARRPWASPSTRTTQDDNINFTNLHELTPPHGPRQRLLLLLAERSRPGDPRSTRTAPGSGRDVPFLMARPGLGAAPVRRTDPPAQERLHVPEPRAPAEQGHRALRRAHLQQRGGAPTPTTRTRRPPRC